MATATVSITAKVTPGVTLSNPVSRDELQALSTPTVSVPSSTTADGVMSRITPTYEIVQATDNALTNGENMRAAYARLVALSPTATAPVSLILTPGVYDLGDDEWTLATPYVDIVGLGPLRTSGSSGQDGVYIYGSYVRNVYDGGFIRCGDSSGATPFSVTNVTIDSQLTFDYRWPDITFTDCRFICTNWTPGLLQGGNYYRCTFDDVGDSVLRRFYQYIGYCDMRGEATEKIECNSTTSKMFFTRVETDLDMSSTPAVYHCAAPTISSGNAITTPYNVIDANI